MLMDSANSEGVKRLVAATGSAVFSVANFFIVHRISNIALSWKLYNRNHDFEHLPEKN